MTIPHTNKIILYTCCILIAAALFIPVGSALTLDPVGSGSSRTPAIANGDPVTLTGIATGHPRDGLQVWVVGRNYLKVSTISVSDDNSFTFELKPSDTQNLASGQYFVVVQHPMMNGQFDVYYNAATGNVINRQLGSGGMSIYQMSGSGSLQGPDSAQALISAIDSQNIDDTFTTYTFTVSPPTAMINPIGDHAVGDKFTISGSTNLAVGDNLMVEVTSSSFSPTTKNSGSEFSGASGVVKIVPGSGGYNRWSLDIDASTFRPDEYIVTVSGITVDVKATTNFNVYDRLPSTPAPSLPVTRTPLPLESTAPVTTAALPSSAAPTQKSPLPAGILATALCIAVLVKKWEKKNS
ncbi:MAG: hypothetical protein GYA23_12315 [Methanomicrobiales archaeon]|nr:hypothetical protein [Methanomicrobiales archaeon]